MLTLGINAAYHDPSACLVRDGKLVAAVEEERFTGIKHGKRPVPFSAYELPFHAIDYCLSAGNVDLADVNHVAYSYNPYMLLNGNVTIELPLEPSRTRPAHPGESVWDPLFLSYLVNAPRQLADGAPHQLKKRFRGVTPAGPYQWHFVEHHRAHAASAFHVSPFQEAAIMTIDGRGEKSTTTYGIGSGCSLDIIGGVNMPDSLGLLYEKITSYLGFLHSSDEYKVMALASFGRSVYEKQFQDAIRISENGAYTIHDMELQEAFGPARNPGAPLEQKHYDIACSVQRVLENTVLELARWLQKRTASDFLCLAGGVALNCVLNSALRDRGSFREIWVQPAAGDAGTAMGAAMIVDAQERGARERGCRLDHAYWGPSYSDAEIETFLKRSRLPYRRTTSLSEEVSDILAKNAVVGWFQGRMEFGPRALGARSILASPVDASMQARLNEIKDREDFRPVAPVVLEEEAGSWFENADISPFMLFVFKVLEEKKNRIPAVCHVDGTARIQTVNRSQNRELYDLLKRFQSRTGVPLLINTSFNTRGKPIVCSPRDAVECFYTSPLDVLAIGSFLLKKTGV